MFCASPCCHSAMVTKGGTQERVNSTFQIDSESLEGNLLVQVVVLRKKSDGVEVRFRKKKGPFTYISGHTKRPTGKELMLTCNRKRKTRNKGNV